MFGAKESGGVRLISMRIYNKKYCNGNVIDNNNIGTGLNNVYWWWNTTQETVYEQTNENYRFVSNPNYYNGLETPNRVVVYCDNNCQCTTCTSN